MRRSKPKGEMLRRVRLRPGDVWRTAWSGVAGRGLRTALSAVGIAVGVAAVIALTSIADSSRTAISAEMDRLGANLLTVEPGKTADGQPLPLPENVAGQIARQDGVEAVGALMHAPAEMRAYRTPYLSEGETNGVTVKVARPDLLAALGADLAAGRWFDDATRDAPVAVLGAETAKRMGVSRPGDRVLVDGEWYGVLGILSPLSLVPDIDTAVILGDRWVERSYPSSLSDPSPRTGEVAALYVRSAPGASAAVQPILADAAMPGSGRASVSPLPDLDSARTSADGLLKTLGQALGAIALVVGGVGIANSMIVAVMERRGEIGLRRALGARPGQVATQFVLEAVIMALLGAAVGVVAGLAVGVSAATVQGHAPVVDAMWLWVSPVAAMAVGVLAGLQPAWRASRVSPNEALRSM